MRPRVGWMTASDDVILEYLDDTGLALPPKAISYNLETREGADISYSTVNRRLKELLNHELVEKEYEPAGFYSITEKGKQYLRGDLSKHELVDAAE